MAKLNPATTLPQSSQDALEIFDERYRGALEALKTTPQTWVDDLGEVHTTPALSTRYPMTILALKYLEVIDLAGSFKRIGEKDVALTVAEYQDGVEIELTKLMSNSFSAQQWAEAPAAMLKSEQTFKLKLIAAALVANTETCGWDDLALFHDAHLSNPVHDNGLTFDNLQASAKDVASLTSLEEEITLMSEVLDTNGDPLGVMPTHIGVPRAKFQLLKNLLKQDFVPSGAGTATMRNPYNDAGLTVVRMDQLTDTNDWYLFDMNLIASGVTPWTVAKLAMSAPGFNDLSLRHWDMSNSDDCRRKGTIAVSSHIYYGSKFLFPHAIRKIAGA